MLIFIIAIFLIKPVAADEKNVYKLMLGDNRWIELHYLLQVHGYSQNIYDANAGENESDDAVWTKRFYLRRSRIILKGFITPDVTFFMQTDDLKVGDQGPAQQYDEDSEEKDKKGIFTQDAFINYKVADELQIACGMIPLPFMHHSRQSAVSLLGVDYNEIMVPLDDTTNEWRDTGVEIRGLLAPTSTGKKGFIDYRIGVWRGMVDRDTTDADTDETDDVNPYAYPRYCGRIQLNILDPETGFFYSGNYLGKRQIVSIGAALDYQNHAVRNSGSLKAYKAWTIDAAVDYGSIKTMVVTLQGAYVRVKNIPGDKSNQYGYFGQAGILLSGAVQPVVKYLYWVKEGADIDESGQPNDNKRAYLIYGLNYYIDGHNANVKLEYQQPLEKDHKADSGEKKATIQCQIFI